MHLLSNRWSAPLDQSVRVMIFIDPQAEGVANTSYTSELLSQGQLSEEEEFVVKWTAASLYSGGADTVGTNVLSSQRYLVLTTE